jgi:hypothetical protein
MHTTGAMPYHTLALVQQLLGNGFKSWIVNHPSIHVFDRPASTPDEKLMDGYAVIQAQLPRASRTGERAEKSELGPKSALVDAR